MIDSIRFVQRAVSSKKFDPVLTHFLIRGGLVKGYNGTLGLCGPIDCDLDMAPNAAQFIRAVGACQDAIALSANKGRLCVKSGPFRTFVDCAEMDSFPNMEPEGTIIELTNPIIPVLKKLEPFIALDASRTWARGILLRGQSAFATNNILLAEYWLGYDFPHELNIPHEAVREILRVGVEPYAMQFSPDRITFFFPEGRWLTSQVYALDWPDVYSILDIANTSSPTEVDQSFYDALETILPFTDDMSRILLHENHIATGTDPEATTVNCVTPSANGIWNAKLVLSIRHVAERADFNSYPAPCSFFGENIRGVLIGLR